MSDTEEMPLVAAAPFMLPPANLQPPKPLLVDDNLASNWKQWMRVWQRYKIAGREFTSKLILFECQHCYQSSEKILSKRTIRLFGALARRKTVLMVMIVKVLVIVINVGM